MNWGCFPASGPRQLAMMEEEVNPQDYHGVLQDNVRVAFHTLKLRRSWVM